MKTLLLLLLTTAGLLAQEKVPSPPFLADAPSESSWTISTRMKSAAQDAPPGRQTTVYKSGDRRREVTVSAKGTKSEIFIIRGLSFQKRSGFAPGDVFVESAGGKGDFPELSWVKAETYVRTETEAGKKYHVYAWTPPVMQTQSTGSSAAGNAAAPAVLEAWIDAETRLPARLKQAKFERIYQFAKSSPQDAEPSEEIRRRVELYLGGKRTQ